ncbi:3',5'-cyclic-AMP phosphodiesterase [Calothrix sp. 336/3]|uniref:3',5'-cyclic-AMP phosphodiesterase n=1 Tax=Calothrix sp. 336/3 TaxID=1337936 RepID=UPI0004E2A085|nr:3',5'-cyclic-AMP phosphodiesterase [Calothrix sp. 336/3]AKG22972.1 3',5'-cyclic-nucleotide phosphodiesterase [Calothrix sp. 336/3]
MNQTPAISIAQVTDTHLFVTEEQELLGIPTIKSFQAVVKRLEEMRSELDLILLTGDISGDGTETSYETVQNLLRPLQIPTYWVPGNHDSAIAMDEILNLGLISRRKCFERGGWNFILLDSTVPDCVHGCLSSATLTWLDRQLQTNRDKPTLIALHHPPFAVNCQWLDSIGLHHPEEFFAVIDKYPQVQLVLLGHIHQEFHYQRREVDYLGTPSTCVQFLPKSPQFAVDSKPPGFRIVELYSNGTWKSKIERVPFFHAVELAATGY